MVLAGEEIPDLLQKLAADHPDTDPLLAALNRYHRTEEARHLSFARTVLPEAWARAGWIERQRVRFAAPLMIDQLWKAFVHPGVYATVGLAHLEDLEGGRAAAPSDRVARRSRHDRCSRRCSTPG